MTLRNDLLIAKVEEMGNAARRCIQAATLINIAEAAGIPEAPKMKRSEYYEGFADACDVFIAQLKEAMLAQAETRAVRERLDNETRELEPGPEPPPGTSVN